MTKIVVAMDSFKGTMSSKQACDAVKLGIESVYHHDIQVVTLPIADGGEGTVDAYLSCLGGKRIEVTVTGPDFNKVDGYYGILPDGHTAVIEMAAASGITLVSDAQRQPIQYTTMGTGELMVHAMEHGCDHIILGLGGSATNDGGVGALTALGIEFLDQSGNRISPNCAGLEHLCDIGLEHIHPCISSCQISIACDVTNPLCGDRGASAVYGPQKGADQYMVQKMDQNLQHFAEIIRDKTGKDIISLAGGGAAGGTAAGIIAFCNAEIQSGIELLLDTVQFDSIIADASLVITGEGKIDNQSSQGKVLTGIGAHAKKMGIPIIALVGDMADGYQNIYSCGISAVFSINHLAKPYQDIKHRAKVDLTDTTRNIFQLLKCVALS